MENLSNKQENNNENHQASTPEKTISDFSHLNPEQRAFLEKFQKSEEERKKIAEENEQIRNETLRLKKIEEKVLTGIGRIFEELKRSNKRIDRVDDYIQKKHRQIHIYLLREDKSQHGTGEHIYDPGAYLGKKARAREFIRLAFRFDYENKQDEEISFGQQDKDHVIPVIIPAKALQGLSKDLAPIRDVIMDIIERHDRWQYGFEREEIIEELGSKLAREKFFEGIQIPDGRVIGVRIASRHEDHFEKKDVVVLIDAPHGQGFHGERDEGGAIMVPIQIKSSEHGRKSHQKKHSEIPSMVVTDNAFYALREGFPKYARTGNKIIEVSENFHPAVRGLRDVMQRIIEDYIVHGESDHLTFDYEYPRTYVEGK